MSKPGEISDLAKRREEAHWRACLDRRDAEQGRLPFDAYYQNDEADLHLRIKRAAALDLKACRYSRTEVADAIGRLIGRPVSTAQIDAIVAESHAHRLPAEWIPAWCRVTGSTRILEMLCAEAGLWLADDTEHDLAELARAELNKHKAAERAAVLRKLLAGKV